MELRVPDLRDDVVVLRPPETGDVDAITAACQDPEIPRFTRVPSPYRRDDAVTYVEQAVAAWRDGSAAGFVVTDAATGALVGSIGVMRLEEHPTAEIGYWVALDHRGRGVATRALHLVSRWAIDTLGVQRLELMTSPENDASQALAARAGFVREGLLRAYATHGCGRTDVVMFSLVPADLAAPPGDPASAA